MTFLVLFALDWRTIRSRSRSRFELNKPRSCAPALTWLSRVGCPPGSSSLALFAPYSNLHVTRMPTYAYAHARTRTQSHIPARHAGRKRWALAGLWFVCTAQRRSVRPSVVCVFCSHPCVDSRNTRTHVHNLTHAYKHTHTGDCTRRRRRRRARVIR